MLKKIPDIRSLLGNTLDSRDEAIRLFELLKSNYPEFKEITLDFTSIDFMSRSFADQFHKERLKWAQQDNVKILITNAPIQVIDILHAVSKTQNGTNRVMQDLPVYAFSKSDQLSHYLQAI